MKAWPSVANQARAWQAGADVPASADDLYYLPAWLSEAYLLYEAEHYEEAVRAYDCALRLAPKEKRAWQGKAACLYELKRYDEALATYDEALRRFHYVAEVADAREHMLRALRRTIPDREMRLRDGRRLGYLDYGDPSGAAVICCHGLPGSRLAFPYEEDIPRTLNARIIVPDRPGLGLSDFQLGRRILDWPSDAAQLADHLGIERFAVLGVSGGGAYAAACAYALPERVTRLGLVASAAPFAGYELGRQGFSWNLVTHSIIQMTPWPVYRLLFALIAHLVRIYPEIEHEAITARLSSLERAALGKGNPGPVALEDLAEPYRQGGIGEAWENKLAARPWGFPLEKIAIQTYLWHGEKDTLAPPAMGRYLARTIPNCRATFYPDEGHLLLTNHWREILATLAAPGA